MMTKKDFVMLVKDVQKDSKRMERKAKKSGTPLIEAYYNGAWWTCEKILAELNVTD